MSTAWDILCSKSSTPGSAWSKLNNITGGGGSVGGSTELRVEIEPFIKCKTQTIIQTAISFQRLTAKIIDSQSFIQGLQL